MATSSRDYESLDLGEQLEGISVTAVMPDDSSQYVSAEDETLLRDNFDYNQQCAPERLNAYVFVEKNGEIIDDFTVKRRFTFQDVYALL